MIGALVLSLGLGAALTGEPTAVARGRHLFNDAGVGKNGVACSSCHAVVENEDEQGDGLIRAGHTMFGVAKRSHWRGDSRRTAYPRIENAINVCVQIFQGGDPLDAEDTRRLALYLKEISAARAQAPLQIQSALEANLDYDRPKYRGGDPSSGRTLFYRACHSCHPRGGQGLGPAIHGASAPQVALRVREGNGLLRGARQPSAWMPFFGRDRLSDQQVADIAAYIETLPAPATAARE